ncbi:MAG: hypothetical protein RQ875_06805 [Vicingaceae bacterium]|nr:hypothetical protein [Vicingaceae bacterium]
MENLYNETIEKLLLEKSFSELTPTEKEKVLQLYSILEYDQMHNYLVTINLICKKDKHRMNVSSRNKFFLQDYFKEKNKPEQRLISRFYINNISFQPYIKGAALTAFATILFFIFYGKINQSNEYHLPENEFNKYTTFNSQEIPKYNADDETTDYLMKVQF